MRHREPWILRAAQQRALDEASIRSGLLPDALMASAGAHAAEWVLDRLAPKQVVILAGPGGNGGDAYVVARHLHDAGVNVAVFCRGDLEASSQLTQQMAQRYTDSGKACGVIPLIQERLQHALTHADCLIDGLFGSGLTRPLAGEDVVICEIVNANPVTTVCLDVPSGINSDEGELLGPAIRADVTLAMAFYKPCHFLHPAAAWCGAVSLVDVDYPATLRAQTVPTASVTTKAAVAASLPPRRPDGHKGTFGHVVVIAGSQGMTGAAILCARAALRTGAGRLTIVLPEDIAAVIQLAIPEATTYLLPEGSDQRSPESIVDQLTPILDRADVLALGPGLGRDERVLERVRLILRCYLGQLVIDADAIHALIGHEDLLASISERAVLTPHPGEFSALIQDQAVAVDRSRLDQAAAFAATHRLHLVLKGHPTVIGLSSGDLFVNPTGNTGLATGGSGDVLTGLIAGLVAGGMSLDDAAVASPYIHGMIADQWAVTRAERSLLPSDLVEELPHILKELET